MLLTRKQFPVLWPHFCEAALELYGKAPFTPFGLKKYHKNPALIKKIDLSKTQTAAIVGFAVCFAKRYNGYTQKQTERLIGEIVILERNKVI